MTNLVNLQRDMRFVMTSGLSVAFPTTTNKLNSDGVVYSDVGTLRFNTVSSSAATQYIGVMMQQPTGEKTPYRVKGYLRGTGTSQWVVGFADTQTGTNDTVSNVTNLGAGVIIEVDEIVCMEESSGAIPLFFGFVVGAPSASFSGQMSVQRLNVVPPRFSSIVS